MSAESLPLGAARSFNGRSTGVRNEPLPTSLGRASRPSAASTQPDMFTAARASHARTRGGYAWAVGRSVATSAVAAAVTVPAAPTLVAAAGSLVPWVAHIPLLGALPAAMGVSIGMAGVLTALCAAPVMLALGVVAVARLSRCNVGPWMERMPGIAMGCVIGLALAGPWSWPMLGVACTAALVVNAAAFRQPGTMADLVGVLGTAGVATAVGSRLAACVACGVSGQAALAALIPYLAVATVLGSLAFLALDIYLNKPGTAFTESFVVADSTVQRYRLAGVGEAKPTIFSVPEPVVDMVQKHRAGHLHGLHTLTLAGPPGCGKTATALALGHALNAQVITVSAAQLQTGLPDRYPTLWWNLLSVTVDAYAMARESGRPVVLIWDEADGIWSSATGPSFIFQVFREQAFRALNFLGSIAAADDTAPLVMVNTTNHPERMHLPFTSRRLIMMPPDAGQLQHMLATALHREDPTLFASAGGAELLQTLQTAGAAQQLHRHGCSGRHVDALAEQLSVALHATTSVLPAELQATVQRCTAQVCEGQDAQRHAAEVARFGAMDNDVRVDAISHVALTQQSGGLQGDYLARMGQDVANIVTTPLADPVRALETKEAEKRFGSAVLRLSGFVVRAVASVEIGSSG